MSQFILTRCNGSGQMEAVEFRPILPAETWLLRAAEVIFGTTTDVVVPVTSTPADIHELFDEAFSLLREGVRIEGTPLYGFLQALLRRCREVALWWGDECRDLPIAADREAFISTVAAQLLNPMGDVYVRWSREGSGAT